MWCAGCNPSSVLWRHSAMRATRAPSRKASAPIRPCTLRVSRLTQARSDLPLQGIIAHHGRYRFCPLPRVSPYASQRRSPTRWMEFPQPFDRQPPPSSPKAYTTSPVICFTKKETNYPNKTRLVNLGNNPHNLLACLSFG